MPSPPSSNPPPSPSASTRPTPRSPTPSAPAASSSPPCPALLLDVTVDNSQSDDPVTAFLGLRWLGDGLLRPLDWSSPTLCGVALANRFALAAHGVPKQIHTLCGQDFATALENTQLSTRIDANAGGIAFKVAPRTTHTVTFAFAFHHAGLATYGLDGRYLFGRLLPAHRKRRHLHPLGRRPPPRKLRHLRRPFLPRSLRLQLPPPIPPVSNSSPYALRHYDACTQLTDARPPPAPPTAPPRSSPSSPARVPCATPSMPPPITSPGNSSATRGSSATFLISSPRATPTPDQIFFPEPARRPRSPRRRHGPLPRHGRRRLLRPARSTSASEAVNATGAAGFLTSESVLNAIYLLTSYALTADDNPWAKTRLPFARELLTSLENRDHADPRPAHRHPEGPVDPLRPQGRRVNDLRLRPPIRPRPRPPPWRRPRQRLSRDENLLRQHPADHLLPEQQRSPHRRLLLRHGPAHGRRPSPPPSTRPAVSSR